MLTGVASIRSNLSESPAVPDTLQVRTKVPEYGVRERRVRAPGFLLILLNAGMPRVLSFYAYRSDAFD